MGDRWNISREFTSPAVTIVGTRCGLAEVTAVLDVGPLPGPDATEQLISFVDRLATESGDRTVRLAAADIRKQIAAGTTSVGLRRVAVSTAAAGSSAAAAGPVAIVPPQSRRPGDDSPAVSDVLAEESLAVLVADRPSVAAAAVASLLAAGRRVQVTAGGADELAALRSALPDPLGRLCLGDAPPLTPAELRRLRGLLATTTRERLSRVGQDIPPADAVPDPQRVAELCQLADRGRPRTMLDLIPGMLGSLEEDRRSAVRQLAQWVHDTLAALYAAEYVTWAWPLLERLVSQRDQRAFEQLVADASHLETDLAADQAADSEVGVPGQLSADAVRRLRDYAAFLDAGGRPRLILRSPEQRAVEPVLRDIRIERATALTRDGVHRILEHMELRGRFQQLAAACQALGVPAPRTESDVPLLAAKLRAVEAAARAVGALRHDVLFLRADSPVAVPDLATAAEVARAIVETTGVAEMVEADRALERMVDRLRGLVPEVRQAPEHGTVVDALVRRDPADYAAAVDELAAARRQAHDQSQCAKLFDRLRAAAPQLAEAWDRPGSHPTLGCAVLSTTASLLRWMPAVDSTDVLVMLGADLLPATNLLLAAAAPRVLAVGSRAAVENGGANGLDPIDSVLAAVLRAGGLVITEAGPDVVPIGGDPTGRDGAADTRNGRPMRVPHQITVSTAHDQQQRQTPA